MLKTYYENMKNTFQAQFNEKPRAFTRMNIELASILAEAYRPDKKVVWTSFYSFPMELLAAFDVATFDFEIAANILPTVDPDGCVNIMSRAEEEGYSTDLCSFHRLAMGCQLLGYMPRADLLCSSTYFCDGKAMLNRVLAQYHGKEAVTLDVPNRITRETVGYVTGQIKAIAHKLEEVTGRQLDHDRLSECIKESNLARKAYGRLAEIYKSKPFPWNGRLAYNMSIFGNMLNGKPQQKEIYDTLWQECRDKLDKGVLAPDRFRIMWLAWYPLQPTIIGDYFRRNAVAIVTGELIKVFWDEIDERDPWEGMALRCLKNPYVGAIDQRLGNIIRNVDEYDIDGVVHFSTDACRHSCAGSHLIGDALQKKGIPYLVLEGDLSDKRKYSEERTRHMLENFVEVMANRKH
jgi:benzoyl-CoA reductase/2-hydroxyglutaryl-CoA dehydratase subunit BcrC/BadD/HgdB